MIHEKVYQVALSLVPGIGDVLVKQLISHFGSAGKVFHLSKGKLALIPRVGKKMAGLDLGRILRQAESMLGSARSQGILPLFYLDKDYPRRLKQVQSAPPLIWYKGSPAYNSKKIISIVGTRRATSYGKSIVRELISGLKKHKVAIVSGLAYGIDIEAHRRALEEDLPTIAVIAGGHDQIYPPEHRKEVFRMLENGGVLSEQCWGTLPEAHHFPRRNRIIAGLSDATVVIEAASKGGALITAEYAYSYDRDIFAVPGNLDQRYSLGCNLLIENLKANIYTGVESLEKILNWDLKPGKQIVNYEEVEKLSPEEIAILEILEEKRSGLAIQELSWRSQVSLNQLASILLNLEFKGIVRSLPGNHYKIN